MNQLRVLRHILNHPLNRGRELWALRDYLRWQVVSRVASRAAPVPFVNDSVLMMRSGMHGATQNIYCGLADFSEMAFLLHLLRPDDLFVDVGANVGSYTVLASAAIGAHSLAFEPNPETFPALLANIEANGIGGRVSAHRAGAGARSGVLRFEADGPKSRVAVGGDVDIKVFESPVSPLNETLAGLRPVLIKIDVEGFESDVLAGADEVLRDPGLLAVSIENNPECVRFGFAPDQAHTVLLSHGFAAVEYSPRERRLTSVSGSGTVAQNSIYIRSHKAVAERLAAAPAFRVKGQVI